MNLKIKKLKRAILKKKNRLKAKLGRFQSEKMAQVMSENRPSMDESKQQILQEVNDFNDKIEKNANAQIKYLESLDNLPSPKVIPLKTPEEVAAEERKSFIVGGRKLTAEEFKQLVKDMKSGRLAILKKNVSGKQHKKTRPGRGRKYFYPEKRGV